ncbi:MAG: hypothetical protein ACTHXC_16270, partial [Brachybacterium sp.]
PCRDADAALLHLLHPAGQHAVSAAAAAAHARPVDVELIGGSGSGHNRAPEALTDAVRETARTSLRQG